MTKMVLIFGKMEKYIMEHLSRAIFMEKAA